MPDVDAILQFGPLPASGGPADEPSLLVQSITITPAREKKIFKGVNKATQTLQYTDPILTFAFKCYIAVESGLAVQHPGTQVTELANYAGIIHGFDSEQGTLVYEDPSRDLDNENPDAINFNVVYYPFVV